MIPRSSTGIDIKYEKKSLSGYKKIEPGDFVVHLRSFQGGFAYSDLTGIVSPAYTVFTFKQPEMFNNYFWKEKFTSYNFIQLLKKVTYGVRDGRSISYSDFLTLNEKFPVKVEQTKIADLFKIIDNLITLQQRKLEHLKQLKKALLQQLFVDKNNKQPNLRFKNFNGDWEQHKLKDISAFENGRAYKQNELLKEGKYPVLRVGNFYTKDQWYYSNLELDKNKYANNGDLLYTWSATFGPHIWNGPQVIYHYHIWKIQISNKINKFFLYSFLEADKVNLLHNTNGSTMIHITKSNMENKVIMYPKTEEQLKIGQISSHINNSITLQQNKLTQLSTLKKYLLQKMFI